MKYIYTLLAALSAGGLLLSSCDDKSSTGSGGTGGAATSEASALERFKGEVLKIKAWQEEKQKEVDANPMSGLALIKEMSAKMSAVKTDGLPADLKTAYTAAVGKISEMAALFKGMPAKPEEMQAWLAGAGAGFQAKMEKIGTEIEPLMEKLKEAAKKHGVDLPDMKKKG